MNNESHSTDESQAPNIEADLHRIPIGAVLHMQYIEMNEEFRREMEISGSGIRGSYPSMSVFEQMARAQARGFGEILKKYDEAVKQLNENYGDIYYRGWSMYLSEARKRKELLENLSYDLGLTRTDERPEMPEREVYSYAYQYDGRQLVYDLFRQRLRENRNLVILFSGRVGGGKSYGSLSVADYLVPEMKVGYDLKSLVYSIEEFIQQIKTLPPGEVVIMDEAGVTAGSRDFASRENKVLSKVIQSIRYLQHCSIFSLPNINFLDKSIRLMIDVVFDHPGELRQGEFSPYVPVLSDDGKDVVMSPFTIGSKVIRTVYFPLPRPSLIADYERKRRQHNMEQLDELQESISSKPEADGRGKNPNSIRNLKPFRGDKDE
jgi:hypothetical protein